ncbi:MAG TPA: prepilin peptidase [Candidatus Paceibacterota bacterium]
MELLFSSPSWSLFSGIFIFLLGTIIGSFLNVVALRYNTGLNLSGRSRCFSCERPLLWFELVPLFSFLLLKGRCRTCGSLLSLQYPVVELLTGVVFSILFIQAPSLFAFFAFAFISSLFIVIGIYDIRHTIVPNGLSYAAAFFSFLMLFVDLSSVTLHVPTFLAVLAGPLIASPFFLLWLFSHGRWMGLGDAKLALSIGWLLGISGGSVAFLVAFWSGAVIGIFSIMLQSKTMHHFLSWSGVNALPLFANRLTIKSEIPFAPFLLLGFFITLFYHLTIFEFIPWPL